LLLISEILRFKKNNANKEKLISIKIGVLNVIELEIKTIVEHGLIQTFAGFEWGSFRTINENGAFLQMSISKKNLSYYI